jgi:quinol monooxygenase YgiN
MEKLFYNPYVTLLLSLLTSYSCFSQTEGMLFRISEIEIYQDSLQQYKAILKEEAEASLRLEPGVISIFPMFQKKDSTQIRILEIYASKEAYQAHIKSPHFLKYKTSTLKMVKSLVLNDMEAIDPETLTLMFKKAEKKMKGKSSESSPGKKK